MPPPRKQTLSRERRKFVSRVIPIRSGYSLALSHQRVAVKRRSRRCWSRPPAGEAGRAEGASLDGRRLVRQRAQQRQVRSASAAHCTDLLSTKQNPDSCNVRRCQENCDKSLRCHTTDRRAPWVLYPAIKRSVVCASPVLRNSSTSCDQAKSESASLEQISCRFRAVGKHALW
jgi:hypothetical protein